MGSFAVVSLLLSASAADRLAFYADSDGDGYGDPSRVRYATGPTAGYTRQGGDCDDRDAAQHPGAAELCNGLDDDCDGVGDDDDPDIVGAPTTWYIDRDDDGFGDPRFRMRSCGAPYGYVDIALDCNDGDGMMNPAAFEFCGDGDDDDCDGSVDECDLSLDDAALFITTRRGGTSARGPMAAADLDGDGTGDLVVGVLPYSSEQAVYLVYGPASGTVFVDDGVTIGTTSTDDWFGSTIGGGDADADGFDDLLVGAAGKDPAVTYLFLGPVTADRDASSADAVLTNTSPDNDSVVVPLVLSDHDGDGAPDIAVASGDDGDMYRYPGAVYVAPGATTGTLSLDSDATYIYEGEWYDFLGDAIADLGDMNGDGIDDLAMWATRGEAIFLVEGGLAPGRYGAADVATTTIEGTRTTFAGGFQGVDYDGDGATDVIAGDLEARNSAGDYAGAVYALVAPWAAAMDVHDAMATWEWTSAWSATVLGYHLAADDFDGDSETDLIIGASGNYNGNDSGAVFFQFGVASGLVDVDSLPYVTGPFDGAYFGVAVAALPDWNGDGIPEAAFAALHRSPSVNEGAIYGFFSGVSY